MADQTDIRILFLGTPEFAATALKKLIEQKANVVAVVTAPDKPAGRGLQIQKSAVKIVAEEAGIPILQPERLKNPEFLRELESCKPDLGIVVAFRMLPELVWRLPRLGTFNLHASLLPSYRGAAPINWAIMNGETKTGITTFFLQHEIDTGDLLLQETVEIAENENVGSLYSRLMHQGSELIIKTLRGIAEGTLKPFPQDESKVSHAPKIFKETCLLDFRKSSKELHNQIRGLSPHPGAYFLREGKVFKVFESRHESLPSSSFEPGLFRILSPGVLGISTGDHWLNILEIQPEGKRKMTAKEFLAGHSIEKL
jgi:methionyl-tRNA formyltransferase